MSYITAATVTTSDLGELISGVGKIKEIAMGLGATDVRGAQMVMGGDQAGLVQVQFDCPNINTSLGVWDGLYQTNEQIDLMKRSGTQIVRRSLLRVAAERGERSGAWVSGLLIAGDRVDDETSDANLGDAWANMSAGANGMLFAETIAAGATQNVAPLYALSWCDDVDGLMAAAAESVGNISTDVSMLAVAVIGAAFLVQKNFPTILSGLMTIVGIVGVAMAVTSYSDDDLMMIPYVGWMVVILALGIVRLRAKA